MILGIDLGTTNSVAAVWDNGKARLLKTRYDRELLPSVVSLMNDGSLLIGDAAKERLSVEPHSTFAVFKRAMGTRKAFGPRSMDAVTLSSLILRVLKEDAEAELGVSVTDAVITVPAYFNEPQRKDTRRAAELAGLRVRRLLNEPTAAAIAYSLNEQAEETKIIVLDLGGGTFDISIIEKFEDVLDIHASGGDSFLGGEDFTEVLRSLLAAQLPPNFQHDHRLYRLAELCKKQLTTDTQWEGRILIQEKNFPLRITRQAFEDSCHKLMERLQTPIDRALRDAGIKPSELDHIVFAGGATRMPLIRRFVSQYFKKFPLAHLDPDTVVAQGAAIVAGMEADDVQLRDRVMTDVCPFTLGVGVHEAMEREIFSPIIERNQKVPISRERLYQPIHPDQKSVVLPIYQGESRALRENVYLGEIEIPITKRPATEEQIKVRFTYDISGLLDVDVETVSSGLKKSMTIMRSDYELSDSELEARQQQLKAYKVHPRDSVEIQGLIARGQRLFRESLGNTREQISSALAALEAAVTTQDTEVIRNVTAQMDEFFRALEEAYEL